MPKLPIAIREPLTCRVIIDRPGLVNAMRAEFRDHTELWVMTSILVRDTDSLFRPVLDEMDRLGEFTVTEDCVFASDGWMFGEARVRILATT